MRPPRPKSDLGSNRPENLDRLGKLAVCPPPPEDPVSMLTSWQDFAVRQEDTIDPSEKKPQKVKGRGSYKRWLPAAILRACWGLKPRTREVARPRYRIKKKSKCRPHTTAPTVGSARTNVATRNLLGFILFFRADVGCKPFCFFESNPPPGLPGTVKAQ
jgi:hypothetical protein